VTVYAFENKYIVFILSKFYKKYCKMSFDRGGGA